MPTRKIFLFFLLLVVLLSSCSINRFIPPGKKLLKKYEIKYTEKKHSSIDNSEVKAYLRPKANSHFLGIYYNLHFYFLSKVYPTKFYNWLNKKLGEDPIYLYDVDPDKLAVKMKRFLANSGFFDANITYEIIPYNKKSKIVFYITLGQPYLIDSTSYFISDSAIRQFVFKDTALSLVKTGDIYNAYTLDDERDRITSKLRDVGYYYFNQSFINFEVDSNYLDHKLKIKTIINNRKLPNPFVLGDFIELPHERYFIKKVTVIPDFKTKNYDHYEPFSHKISFFDDDGETHKYNYTFMLHQPTPRFKPNAFDQSIFIKPGRHYSATDVKETYRRLFSYPIIQTATISFDTTNTGKIDSLGHRYMNARIQVITGKLNFYSVETILTNSSGDPGIRGNILVANRNIFRGAEILRVKVNGGFEAQSISANDSTGAEVDGSFFNTFEAGFDASLMFPRFISPIPFRHFSQKYHPTTNLTLGFNYLQRPNYSRNSTIASIGYFWRKNKKLRFIVSPINFNYVNVNPTPKFQEILDKETNRRLKEQYSDHLIAGGSISLIYDNQKIKSSKSFDYIRLDFETSGNMLYAAQSLLGIKKTGDEHYQFFGVRYSQYARLNIDYRHYFHLYNPGNIIAFRILTGAGIPYFNSNEIPYEKGFYGGGANDMRGWRFRSLGPGGYSGKDNYERVGDIQLETNLEYRFTIYSFVKGAVFTDIGNVWSYNANNYPNGQFKFNTFYKQQAVDMGAGLRFDFTYFIFRLDAGIPVRDPAYPDGERWRFNYLRFDQFIINFGIGYPF